MIALALASMFCLDGLTARDFMPLPQGMKWTYRETGEDNLTYSYEVEQAKTIGGKEATPIVIRYKGNPLSTTYYVVDDNEVGIVAEDDERSIYSPPRPLFRVGADPSNWTYSGQVPFNAGMAPITLTGSSHLGPKKTILGQEVETLEVTIDATLTPPPEGKSKPKPIVYHQVATYGKGLGLIESTNSTTSNGETHPQRLELIKIQRGKSGQD